MEQIVIKYNAKELNADYFFVYFVLILVYLASRAGQIAHGQGSGLSY